jgi:hypothetical protein
MERKFILILMLTAGLLLSREVMATMGRSLSVESVTQQSDLIVTGTVVDQRFVMIDNQPWTLITVMPDESVKGSARGAVHFRIPGGIWQKDGLPVVTRVEGAPQLELMEKGVFFLHGTAPQYLDLVGWNHGYWKVQSDSGHEVAVSASNPVESVPLDRLLHRVRSVSKRK